MRNGETHTDNEELPRPTNFRFATEEEAASLEKSIEEADEFDRHLGRLVRSMATLEDLIDDFIIEFVAPPWAADIFWSRFLDRRGLSRKADDVRKLTEFLPDQTASRFAEIVQQAKTLAQRRNVLVHGVIEVGLPLGESATPFTVLLGKADPQAQRATSVQEMSELVEAVDSVIYELVDLAETDFWS